VTLSKLVFVTGMFFKDWLTQIERLMVNRSKGRLQGPYSQHLILFVTYEWVQ
jgi:hypothetical protein